MAGQHGFPYMNVWDISGGNDRSGEARRQECGYDIGSKKFNGFLSARCQGGLTFMLCFLMK